MLSILAGILIGIAGRIYLNVGGVAGAILFAAGLIVILLFGLKLFTGKAGLIATGEISFLKLCGIWCGNFLGTAVAAMSLSSSQIAAATSIVQARLAARPLELLFNGFLCGILMYAAVTGYKQTQNIFVPAFCVAAFILCGGNHCVADMFYVNAGYNSLSDYWILLPVSFGNLLGCVTIPTVLAIEKTAFKPLNR